MTAGELLVLDREAGILAPDHELTVDVDSAACERALGDNENGHSVAPAAPRRSAKAPAPAGRLPGSFSSEARIAAASAFGSSGRYSRGSTGASSRCASPISKNVLSANGALPTTHSYATQPSAYTSLEGVAGSPRISSGAR